MRFIYPIIVALAIIILVMNSCRDNENREQVVNQRCGSCHQVPVPGLLDKKTWMEGVLPEMGFRMGLKNPAFHLAIPPDDTAMVYGSLPSAAMITEEEWQLILDYYQELAPDSLTISNEIVDTAFNQFDPLPLTLPGSNLPFVTLVKMDTLHHKTYVGTHEGLLYQFDQNFEFKEVAQLPSAPSAILLESGRKPLLSLLGILEPSERRQGQIVEFSKGLPLLIDSLQRPVYFEKADLNNDQKEDFVICAFGNYTGALLAFENLGGGHYTSHALRALPGARHVILRDVNQDGLNDLLVLMTQGDEQIQLMTNKGNFQFESRTLMRFPPVYGSSYFDVLDFNQDGHFDLLYTNGDNGDFSDILKPYHGVRILINDGKENFSESLFYPLFGASKALARDFDRDGDLDIITISFFPDFVNGKQQGIVYLENRLGNFTAHSLATASQGRWLVMDAADIDQDGDVDVVIGAFDYNFHVPENRYAEWLKKKTAVLVLRNKLNGFTAETRRR